MFYRFKPECGHNCKRNYIIYCTFWQSTKSHLLEDELFTYSMLKMLLFIYQLNLPDVFLYMSLTMSSDIQESFNYHGLTYTLSPDCKEHRWRRGSRHTHPAMSCVEALFLCYRAVFLKFLPSSMLQYSNLPQKSEP